MINKIFEDIKQSKNLQFIKHSFDLQILVLDIMKPVHNKGHVSMGCLKKKKLTHVDSSPSENEVKRRTWSQ